MTGPFGERSVKRGGVARERRAEEGWDPEARKRERPVREGWVRAHTLY